MYSKVEKPESKRDCKNHPYRDNEKHKKIKTDPASSPPPKKYCGGSSKFEKLVHSESYVDKTMLVDAVIEDDFENVLVCAPRRFGKSTNLSMLRLFFELNESEKEKPIEERLCYAKFKGTKILTSTDLSYNPLDYMGKYPVMELNFRCDNVVESREVAIEHCKQTIHNSFKQHKYLLDGPLDEDQKQICKKWMSDLEFYNFAPTHVSVGAGLLTEYLYLHFGVPCYVFIDEYDSVCTRATHELPRHDESLDKIVSFVMDIINAVSKDTNYVDNVYVTGVSQICSKGASGCSLLKYGFLRSDRYAPFFGFTLDEFHNLLTKRDFDINSETYINAKKHYNGYSRGDLTILNCWSIVSYLNVKKKDNFWHKTSLATSFKLVFQLQSFREDVMELFNEGGLMKFEYRSNVTYDDLVELREIALFGSNSDITDFDVFHTYLVENGYLSIKEELRDDMVMAKIPNIEIRKELRHFMSNGLSSSLGINYKLVKTCASLFDNIIINFTDEDVCKRDLRTICESIEKMFKNIKTPLNESCLHGVLFNIMCNVNSNLGFLSNHAVGIEATSGKLDIALFNDEYGVIIEAKFNKRPLTGLNHIITMEYLNVLKKGRFFNEDAKRFILIEINIDQDGKISANALFNSVIINDSFKVY